MSYTDQVSEIFEELLREFEQEYPDGNDEIESEEQLHSVASSFVDMKTFVESYNDVVDFIKDYNIRDQAVIKIDGGIYTNFISLFDDAMREEAWNYLISNYIINESED